MSLSFHRPCKNEETRALSTKGSYVTEFTGRGRGLHKPLLIRDNLGFSQGALFYSTVVSYSSLAPRTSVAIRRPIRMEELNCEYVTVVIPDSVDTKRNHLQ